MATVTLQGDGCEASITIYAQIQAWSGKQSSVARSQPYATWCSFSTIKIMPIQGDVERLKVCIKRTRLNPMKLIKSVVLTSVTVLVVTGCSVLMKEHEPLYRSANYYEYIQPTYAKYINITKNWLAHNRAYISKDSKKELTMNMPFELGEKEHSDKAILLVHGLGDSPYTFSDLAQTLKKQGFYVQTLLLPGHGSKPEDLKLPNYMDWQAMVDHYVNLLKQDFDNVWLGGYSRELSFRVLHLYRF